MNPFDFVRSITQTKEYMMTDELAEKAYIPYLINRSLSFDVDTVMYANEMNRCHNLDHRMQYDYYYHLLPKRKFFSKWIKKEEDEDLQAVREYYNCSITKAKEALTILSRKQIEHIKKMGVLR